MRRARHPAWRRRRRSIVSPVRLPLTLLGIALVYGTAGYMLLEGFSVLNAVYMTVTTLTTVGFGEIEPLGAAGRAFTLSLIAIGFVAVTWRSDDGREFVAVHRGRPAVRLRLAGHRYASVLVSVDDPDSVAAALSPGRRPLAGS